MNKTTGIILAIIVIAGGIYFIMKPNGKTEQPTSNATGVASGSATPEEVSQAPVESEVVREIVVEGENFIFAPSEIRVKEGEKVRIVFKNNGGVHNFVVDEFSVATPVINGGEEATVEFIANKKGSFEYYCGVGNHRALGMRGTLIVE